MQELFNDSRVQLFLGKFLSGELSSISPILDHELGCRYPEVEAFVNDPREAEPFLRSLQNHRLITPEICGYLLCCPKCGSSNVDEVQTFNGAEEEGGKATREPNTGALGAFEEERSTGDRAWRCRVCGALVGEGEVIYRPVFSYNFSEEGIGEISDTLVVKPLREFLHERGYRTESPGTLVGESEVEHSYDIIAFSGGSDEGVLVMDFAVSDRSIGEAKVVSMFAKVYDTNPLKSVFVAFPGLTQDARKLADQYKIDLVETSSVSDVWKELRKVIPPVDEFRFEPLDVMTLLSLPDHLRRTATIMSRLGKATADEIADATERARAVESGYLNQLVRMGYLKKERSGRRVLFSTVS